MSLKKEAYEVLRQIELAPAEHVVYIKNGSVKWSLFASVIYSNEMTYVEKCRYITDYVAACQRANAKGIGQMDDSPQVRP